MPSLTERYLAAALRGIPHNQKADVERELRSSIGDAVDDRVGAGESREAAERAVLEGLGDPARLATGMTGKPNYLIGPELFPAYRQLLTLLLGIVVPIVGIALGVVEIATGGTIGNAIVEGGGAALNVAVHLAFWVTLVFALIERYDTAKESAARELADGGLGVWTVDRLPEVPTGRISIGETVGEVLTQIIGIVFLLVLRGLTWTDAQTGQQISILAPELTNLWLPFLVVVLVALIGFRIMLYLLGRWTMAMATVHTVIELAFALPVVYLAINGLLVNPAFAAAVGYPPLAEGDGPVMILIAIGVVLVTAWEIVDGFRQARRADRQEIAASA
jgi:hypothetical protein